MTLTGAVMAPRWTYIDPAIAFNPMLSFEVVIMALFGGAGALLGPILGVVPFVLLFEVLSANFPNYFSILLGLVFLAIVYALPHGVVGLVQVRLPRRRAAPVAPQPPVIKAQGAPLEVEGLRKAFGGLVAVDNLGFSVAPGEIVGLIGPNGSGKTTVLNLISGALAADAGVVRCDGRALAGLGAHQIARLGIARTFQLVRVLESLTAVENVPASRSGARRFGAPKRMPWRVACWRASGSPTRPTRPRRSSPTSTRSDWSSPARSRSSPASSCSMNGLPASPGPSSARASN
jgi:branched-chain amino acid transport system permease protein